MLSSWARSSALSLVLASIVSGAAFEKLHAIPEGWTFEGKPSNDYQISLQIALKQGNVEAFEQALLDMSTPEHASYGKHFQSHDEMKRMLLPSHETVAVVREWLENGGVEDVQEDADWLSFRTTVGVANDLLSTEFAWYYSEHLSSKRLRTLEYSLPDDVSGHVNTIQPTVRFGQGTPNHETYQEQPDSEVLVEAAVAANATNCNTTITPQCLQELYKIDY
ncbi:hypothetical protein EJ04DRAFT_122946, partial [Polyplosphaeria fusca]